MVEGLPGYLPSFSSFHLLSFSVISLAKWWMKLPEDYQAANRKARMNLETPVGFSGIPRTFRQRADESSSQA